MRIYKRFQKKWSCVLYEGDCLSLLKEMPDDYVNLTFTSPPYCMGKEYEATTNVQDFITAHKSVLPEVARVTKPGGSICWQVGYHITDGALTPLDFLVHQIASTIPGLVLRNRIIWSYGFGLNAQERFSGRHESILWYTKNGGDYHFDLDSVRVPQKYPGKKHYKGDKKGQISSNPLGKNPSDVWEIPNVKANHVESTDHPCQFPIGLAQRVIRALCPKRGRVFDPFCGSGSTGAAAILEHRRFVGAELMPGYWAIAKTRIRAAMMDSLRFRPHDQPIFVPDPNSSVARAPLAARGRDNG